MEGGRGIEIGSIITCQPISFSEKITGVVRKKYVNTFLVEVMSWESEEHHDLMEQFRYVLVKG
ncbi:MAG: hypothetical protein ACTIDI_04055 [Pseudolactococcus laudensis]|nr:hypothetical protein [Lactococcus laudensis]